MNIREFLDDVEREIKYDPIKETIKNELKQHIQDIEEEYVLDGMEKKEAESNAIIKMGNPTEIGRKLNKIHRPKLEFKLLCLAILLITYGIINIYYKHIENNLIKNIFIEIGLGFGLGIFIYLFDYRKIKKYSNIIYCLAVLITIIPSIKGDQIFKINLSGININFILSIVAIPLFIIAFVGFLTNYSINNNNITHFKVGKNTIINNKFLKILVLSFLSLILIWKTELQIEALMLGMLYLIIVYTFIKRTSEDKKKMLFWKYSIIISLIIIILIAILVQPARIKNIMALFDIKVDVRELGYIEIVKNNILDNAQLIGKIKNENLNMYTEILQDSNFSFLFLIAQIGILPAFLLVFVIILTSMQIILNSKKIHDLYGKLLSIGIGSLFIIQSVLGILTNVCIGIHMDINIPFVSNGKIFFVVNCINIALLLSIYRRKDINEYELEKKIIRG